MRTRDTVVTREQIRVQILTVTMPERSYMRSSLAEMADAIGNELQEAVVQAFAEG